MQEKTNRKFIERILMEPSYGWADANGSLIKPDSSTLWKQAWNRINIFSSRKNWLSFITIIMMLCMSLFFFNYIFFYCICPHFITKLFL